VSVDKYSTNTTTNVISMDSCTAYCPGRCSGRFGKCNIFGTQGCNETYHEKECWCKEGYHDNLCSKCDDFYYPVSGNESVVDIHGNGVTCKKCDCQEEGSDRCNNGGKCQCKSGISGYKCDKCNEGYFGNPKCEECGCNMIGSSSVTCNNGTCVCKSGFTGPKCDQCVNGYFGETCQNCGCNLLGSSTKSCDRRGQCRCKSGFHGVKCKECLLGHYGTSCKDCSCSPSGSLNQECNKNGFCSCKNDYYGKKCGQKKISIIIAGGVGANYAGLKTVEKLGGGVNYCSLPELPHTISGSPSMILHSNNQLLLCGGYSNQNSCLKPSSYRWTYYNSLKRNRAYSVGVPTSKGYYIFGGEYCKTTSEFLAKGSNKWTMGPSIPSPGISGGCGVAISDEEIFLVGGNKTLSNYMVLNTRTEDKMEYSSKLGHGRYGARCIVFKDKVLITGGYNKANQINFNDRRKVPTEIFDLKITQKWNGGSFQIQRSWHGIGEVTINGEQKVIAFGGIGNGGWLKSVEIWDDTSETWSISKNLQLSEIKHDFGFLSANSDLICT